MIGIWTPPPYAELLVEVQVSGDHVPAGSKRGRAVRYKNDDGKWRIKRWFDKNGDEQAQVVVSDTNSKKLEKRAKVIQQAVLDVARETGFKSPHKDRPLFAVVTFFKSRPRTTHYGSGRNERKLKDSAPAFPIAAADTTKLWRGFEDALTGFVWHDDSRVTGHIADKAFVHWWEEPWTGFALYGLPATVGELREVAPDEAPEEGPQASLL